MRMNFKIDLDRLARMVLKDHLEARGISYEMCSPGEVRLRGELPPKRREELAEALGEYGLEIIDDKQSVLVERIKVVIDEMLRDEDEQSYKASDYLAHSLNYSYSYLSGLFSEATFTSIENYIILRKVDLAKEYMSKTELTLTEIAYRLNYSSVSHLSAQFKKTTGLTPTSFQRIMVRRKERLAEQT